MAHSRKKRRSELRAKFANDAASAERLSSGKAIPLSGAFAYLQARAAGRRAKKPRAISWRARKSPAIVTQGGGVAATIAAIRRAGRRPTTD